MKKDFEVNMAVRPAIKGYPPKDVDWVKDLTVTPRVKKQLIEGFWKWKKEVTGKIAYISKESDRARLRKKKAVMIKLINVSAQSITIIVPKTYLIRVKI